MTNIPKSDYELLTELKNHLQILEDDLGGLHDKPYRTKVVFASLRALVCDSRTGGLLVNLMSKYGFNEPIVYDPPLTLEEYLDTTMLSVSGSETASVSRRDVILMAAQQDGLSHASIDRTPDNFKLNAVIQMAKTDKTDLGMGICLRIGANVLDLGKRFLNNLTTETRS